MISIGFFIAIFFTKVCLDMQKNDRNLQTPLQVYYNPFIEEINNRSYKITFAEIGYLPEKSKPMPLKDVKINIRSKYFVDFMKPEDPQYYSKTLDNYVQKRFSHDGISEEIQYFDVDNDNCLSKGDFCIISNITLSNGSRKIEGGWFMLSFPKTSYIYPIWHGDQLLEEVEEAIVIHNFTFNGSFNGHYTTYTVNVELSSINELNWESFNLTCGYPRIPYLDCSRELLSHWGKSLYIKTHYYSENRHHYVLTTYDEYTNSSSGLMKNDYALLSVYDIYNNETVKLLHVLPNR